MNIRWKMIGIAIPAALMLACTDQPTSTEETTPALAADFSNNPDDTGPYIARYTYGYWWNYWYSEDGSVIAVHTTFPLSLTGRAWDDAICGPPYLGEMHLQEISHWDVTHTDPSALYIENAMGDAWIVLLDNTALGPYPCTNRRVIASGWGRLHYNDNNGTFTQRPQDAWSYRAEGQLTAPTGEKVTYNGHVQCVVNQRIARCNTVVNF